MSLPNQLVIILKADRISHLPDELLYCILSFLPIKDAAVTTVLSKRWKPLFRNITIPFQSFHMTSAAKNTTSNFHNVLYTAMHQPEGGGGGIHDLSLLFEFNNNMKLPRLSLNSKTLTILNLKNVLVLEDPDVVDLPSLKVLHLDSVAFNYSDYKRKLLSGCPNLQDLKTKDLTVKKFSCPSKHIQTLPNLIAANISDNDIQFDCLQNVHHLRATVREFSPLNSIPMFHNLTHMELILDFEPDCGNWQRRWLRELLKKCPNLQTLIMDKVAIERGFYHQYWKDLKTVPECLLSHLTTCSLRNYTHAKSELQFAKYMMQNSRLLNTMKIHCANFIDTYTKLQMLMELSLCPRISATCKLSFS